MRFLSSATAQSNPLTHDLPCEHDDQTQVSFCSKSTPKVPKHCHLHNTLLQAPISKRNSVPAANSISCSYHFVSRLIVLDVVSATIYLTTSIAPAIDMTVIYIVVRLLSSRRANVPNPLASNAISKRPPDSIAVNATCAHSFGCTPQFTANDAASYIRNHNGSLNASGDLGTKAENEGEHGNCYRGEKEYEQREVTAEPTADRRTTSARRKAVHFMGYTGREPDVTGKASESILRIVSRRAGHPEKAICVRKPTHTWAFLHQVPCMHLSQS